MNVASLSFLGFGLAVALLYNVSAALRWRQWVLLFANLAFLSTLSSTPMAWTPYACFLLLGYGSYLLIRRWAAVAYLPAILAVIFTFFWYKKYSFLPNGLFLPFPYVTLGFSYVFFRILSLLIDTRDGVIEEFISPLTFLNYTLNFTAIISGPIQVFPDYASTQLAQSRPALNLVMVGEAIERIVFGLFKISILGSVFQSIQLHYLSSLSPSADVSLGSRVLTGVAICGAYPLYLYFNFSGYTDVVIGVARGIRLTLPENFDRPFSSTNFLDFWSRWHISLSWWLKTYVYSPLLKELMTNFQGASMAGYLGVFAYFVTFFLVGVWHGRTSVFIVFGVLQGGGVAVNKLYQLQMTARLGKKRYKRVSSNYFYQAFSRGLTITFFTFTLMWFWSNWQQMASIYRALRPNALVISWIVIFLLATSYLALYERLRQSVLSIQWGGVTVALSRYTRVVWGTALLLILVVVRTVLSAPAPEVIYKGF